MAMLSCLAIGAATASAQVVVGFQQRFFEKHGDGSTSGDSVPCCTAMGTFDTRMTGVGNAGAYFAEFKNKLVDDPTTIFGGPNPNNRPNNWYGNYNDATNGVTIRRGRFTSMASLMLVIPGGNLRRLTTMLERTVLDLVMRPNNGPGNFQYNAFSLASPHTPGTPTFRAPGTWLGPYPSMAGSLSVVQGPNRFGGTRAIIHTQQSSGVNVNQNPNEGALFDFPVAYGPGVPFTPMNVVRRETRSATYGTITIASPGATTGMVIGSLMDGTGWFTILPYTTGTVMALANTLGTPDMDWTTRTDMGFNNLVETTMGGVTGTLQLVSGHLLQSRGKENTNLAGTNVTHLVFTPEPASAMMLGAGAIGLIGLVIRDRRNSRI